ncbi:MAG: Maf family protein [Acetobacteraceae bacterium]
MTLQRPEPRLVLASASASRRALLAAAGLAFDACPADIDEAPVKQESRAAGADAAAAALRLAHLKAAAVARRMPGALVIGADQILVCEGTWFDKPPTLAAARAQLLALRGRRHTLATAVVCHQDGRDAWEHVEAPCLTMRDFSEDFVDRYLAAEGEAATATVGAYRLEGLGVHLFDAAEGEHSAILGLPLLPLLAFLRSNGVVMS